MTEENSEAKTPEAPKYSIAEIMEVCDLDEAKVRKLIKKAGIDIDQTKRDSNERIRYEDFRLLWVSRANRREGRLLGTMLIEESSNWFSNLLRGKR